MINLIKIEKYGIIMLIDEKYLNQFISKGWKIYNGNKEPSCEYTGDDNIE